MTSRGEPILVSAVTIIELRYLVEKAVLAEADVDAIHAVLDASGSGFEIVPVDDAAAWAVGQVARDEVADPFDRTIAATALAMGVPLVTYDRRLRALPGLPTLS